MILGVYVDDMLVIGNTQKEINEIKHVLTGEFKISDFGLVSWYLGLKITRNLASDKIFLSQTPYIKKILEYFRMQQAKGVDTPMVKQHALVYAQKDYQANSSTIT